MRRWLFLALVGCQAAAADPATESDADANRPAVSADAGLAETGSAGADSADAGTVDAHDDGRPNDARSNDPLGYDAWAGDAAAEDASIEDATEPIEAVVDGPATTNAQYAGCTAARYDEGDLRVQAIARIASGGWTYSPRCARVRLGQRVIFEGTGVHPLRGVPTNPVVDGRHAIPAAEGLPAEVTFVRAGIYGYFCNLHADPETGAGMAGAILVE
jgi:plastocyanin